MKSYTPYIGEIRRQVWLPASCRLLLIFLLAREMKVSDRPAGNSDNGKTAVGSLSSLFSCRDRAEYY